MVLLDLFISYGPWAWFVTGLVLLALELVVPGGYFLWLGTAGILTGLLAFIGPSPGRGRSPSSACWRSPSSLAGRWSPATAWHERQPVSQSARRSLHRP